MRARYGAFVLARVLGHFATLTALVFLVALWWLVHLSVTGWAVVGVVVWVLSRRRTVRRGDDPRDEERELRRRLLRTRLTAAQLKLEMLAPDIGRAARDFEDGKIGARDYDAALEMAAREARGSRGRFRFH